MKTNIEVRRFNTQTKMIHVLDLRNTEDKRASALLRIIVKAMGWMIILLCIGIVIIQTTMDSNAYELSISDKIRLERLEACQQAYKESGIKKQLGNIK